MSETLTVIERESVTYPPQKTSNGRTIRVIEAVMYRFGCPYGTACELVMECAENLKEAA